MGLEWLGEWRESLVQNPCVCRRRVRAGGRTFELILTWSRCDPWELRVAELGDGGAPVRVSEELFEPEGLYFESDEWRRAEAAAEALFARLASSGELERVFPERGRQAFYPQRAPAQRGERRG